MKTYGMKLLVVPKLIAGAVAVVAAALVGCGADMSRRNSMLMFSSVDPSGWRETQPVEFNADTLMTAGMDGQSVRPAVILRYSRLCKTSVLPVEIVQESFGGRERRDTVIMHLFDSRGDEPLGRGSYSVYELGDTLAPIAVSEGWRLTVAPLADVRGIHAVGIEIIPD